MTEKTKELPEMEIWNPNKIVMPRGWWIEGLIPKNAIVGIISQAGSGKSTLVDTILTYLYGNKDFLGRKTEGCNVLLIDQDSEPSGLDHRLKRLRNQVIDGDPQFILGTYIYKELYFSDRSLYNIIRRHPECKVVVIDSYHKFGGPGYNYDNVGVVSQAFGSLRKSFGNDDPKNDRTVIILHHATEHPNGIDTADDYMTTTNFSGLAMDSSAFIESVDCYFITSSPDKGDELKTMYVRPRSKRVLLPNNDPFVIDVKQDYRTLDLSYAGLWKPTEKEIHQDIMLFFNTTKTMASVDEVFAGMGKKHNMQPIRDSLRELRNSQQLIECRKAHGLLKYYLPGTNVEESEVELTKKKKEKKEEVGKENVE